MYIHLGRIWTLSVAHRIYNFTSVLMSNSYLTYEVLTHTFVFIFIVLYIYIYVYWLCLKWCKVFASSHLLFQFSPRQWMIKSLSFYVPTRRQMEQLVDSYFLHTQFYRRIQRKKELQFSWLRTGVKTTIPRISIFLISKGFLSRHQTDE